jgi:hypothetical protein
MPSLIAIIRRVACACIPARSVIPALQLPTACTIRPRFQELQGSGRQLRQSILMQPLIDILLAVCMPQRTEPARFEVPQGQQPSMTSVSLQRSHAGLFHAAHDMVLSCVET